MRSYSSAVRPDSLARSSVTLGEAPVTRLPLEEAAVLDEAAEEALEQLEPVRAAHRRLGRALGMRHEAEHVALRTHDARDVLERAVRIRRPRDAPVGHCVAEDHLVPRPELTQRFGVRVVLALAVGDRHREHLPGPEPPRERRLDVVHDEVGGLAAVLQALVARERPRQEPRLAEDLEAVARAEDRAAPRDELAERLDDRRAPGDGARAEIVAVREPARQDDAVEVTEVALPVPNE